MTCSGWQQGTQFCSVTRVLISLILLVATSLANAETDGHALSDRSPEQETLTASGPEGPLEGTLTLPPKAEPVADDLPVVLIVPGSGPTDRNGNSPLGISAASYEMLAKALAEHGYPSLRIDKRGMFGSADAITDANNVTIAEYSDDLLSWTRAIRERLPVAGTGERCVVPLGHSEGGLVALAASTREQEGCGLILIASPGRPLGDVLREQLQANPANAYLLAEAEVAIAAFERGERVNAATLNPALQPLFAADVQDFLIDALSYDPAKLAATVEVPMLVIQGTKDLQVNEADARALADAARTVTLAIIPDVNHVLKAILSNNPSANLAAYTDPNLPIAPEIVHNIIQFLAALERK